jgi:hypothetical protein
LRAHRFACSFANPVNVHQEVGRPTEYLIVPIRRRIDHEPWALYPTNEFSDGALYLQPRERTAKTEMDAATVAKMLVVLAFEVDFSRVFEAAAI